MAGVPQNEKRRLGNAVRKIEGLQPPPGEERPPLDAPILLVRAQEDIPTESSGDVKQLLRPIDTADKGDEEVVGDAFEIYNRFAGIEEDDDFFVRWNDGGWEALSRGATVEESGFTCGSCNQLPGTYTVEIDDPVFASTTYEVAVTCGGEIITLTWDSALTWLSGVVSVQCGGGSENIDLELGVTGYLPGQVSLAANGVEATWTNETAWQPETALLLRLTTYDPECPCSPFQPYVCLVPTVGA